MLIDFHIHALAHGEYRYTQEWITQFLEKAKVVGIKEIGFCEHDEFIDLVDFSVIRKAQTEFQNLRVRIGMEVDYKPGREPEIADLINKKSFDYVMGSVHHIGEWMFDHPDYRNGFDTENIDNIYSQYFNLVDKAFNSRLFDVLGHLDLVKVWGHRPVKRPDTYFLEPLLHCIKQSGIVVEVNSSGLRKPVGEIYPSQSILDQLFNHNIPVTMGSDAHHPDQVGEGLDEVAKSIRQAGYRVLVSFTRRQKVITPMG
ncbi:MAG: histidinol-phosphatase HisJ family protein [Chitinophagales bacterium]